MIGVSLKVLLAVSIAGVLASLFFSFIIFPRIQEPLNLNIDPDNCGELAKNIFQGRGFTYNHSTTPAIDRGPVYPYLVAGVFWLVGQESIQSVQVFQSLCHGLTCFLIVLVARRAWNERAAFIAGILCAIHPMLIWYTSRIWIETVHTLLVTIVALLTVRLMERASVSRSIVTGLAMGIAILTKSILILFPLLFGILLLIQWKQQGLRAAAALVLAAACVVTPWTLRNYEVSGHVVPVHTSLGLNLLQGDAIGDHWADIPFSTLEIWQKGNENTNAVVKGTGYSATDPDGDRLLVCSSLSFNFSHPIIFLKRIIINGLTFWYLSESPLKSIFLILLQYPLVVLVVIASTRSWQTTSAQPLILLIFYFFVCHSLIVGWARYSVPIVPVCVLLASIVLAKTAGTQTNR